MNFAKFQELVTTREGFRTMDDATVTGEYFSDSCGDLYTFYLKVGRDEVIEDVSYFTTGCGFGTATCSLLVELARGKTVDEAMRIDAADLEAALGGYPEKKKDYPERSIAALRNAIENYRSRGPAPAAPAASLETADTPSGGTGDVKDGPRVLHDGGKITIKLGSIT
ncbi:MAG TPA: iron-sulfur cluster assembly scaffold protein [Candidatus Dormibacteraeota bacterium]|nr:iron-sulfur cluster assembly scaffold protein [Candidatus Dormibacteraeota bacterium]